eukprot:461560_1
MDQDEESFSAKVIIPLILLLQTIFYLVVLFFFTVLGVDGNSVGLLFDPQQFNSNSGNAVIVSFSIASIPCAFLVTWIVKQAQRSQMFGLRVSNIHIALFIMLDSVSFPLELDVVDRQYHVIRTNEWLI